MKTSALARFEETIRTTDDVFVSKHQNRKDYLVSLESSLRGSLCDPFEISAKVTEPGLEGLKEGSQVSGTCIAEANGYWLVYNPARDTFLIFLGMQKEKLGAPGIEGSPLACWSA